MKKILVIFTTGFNPYGGLTTVMMNYWRAMDKSDLCFDFACTNDPEQELLDEVISQGCSYIKLPPRKHVLQYFRALKKISRNYDIAHVHGNSSTSLLELSALLTIPVRIVHNHNSTTEHPYLNKLLHPFFLKSYTTAIACSELAGDWLFGKNNFTILKNAINIDRFKPSPEKRAFFRKFFGFSDDDFVLGNVGKLVKQKNHFFLLDIFSEYKKINPQSKLLLIGGGTLDEEIRKKADQLNISKSVVMAGMRTDIPEMMSVMDAFIFPSLWEGLPLSALEAQASGLPIFLSNVISPEVAVSEACFVNALQDSPQTWAESINNKATIHQREKRVKKNKIALTEAGFNIYSEANKLKKLYLEG